MNRPDTRIIVEKPFGYDLESARKLNSIYASVFKEHQIYRIDHFLGKETAQNILAFRFANGIFEPLWNRNYIDYVEITAVENLGIEGRGGFYEGAGALRDMVQNHLIQLVALTALEPPAVFNADNFRNEVVSLCTGLRIGEVCALKWSDINVSEGTITVNRTIERIYIINGMEKHTELVINTPKTQNSCREIPITKELLAMVKPLKKVVNEEFYVLTNDEYPTEPRTYRNYYGKLMAKLGIPKLKYHGLRHSFATRCIEAGCDYKTVSVLLGHSNISTTLDLYVHPNMEQKKRCIAKVFKSLGK